MVRQIDKVRELPWAIDALENVASPLGLHWELSVL